MQISAQLFRTFQYNIDRFCFGHAKIQHFFDANRAKRNLFRPNAVWQGNYMHFGESLLYILPKHTNKVGYNLPPPLYCIWRSRLPCTPLPSQAYACVTARVALFYVPRLVLNVGTSRARHSECHPGHSFTAKMAVWLTIIGTNLP